MAKKSKLKKFFLFTGCLILLYCMIGAVLLRTETIQRLYIFPGWSIKYGSDENSKFSFEAPIIYKNRKMLAQINKEGEHLTIIKKEMKENDSVISVKDENGKLLFHVDLKKQINTEPYSYDFPGKVFVVSDVEGNFSFFEKLLKSNGIIDDKYNWSFGNNHLVLLGDYFDRGSQVFESLWLIYKLEEQAEKNGGKVHFILGNHDIMNLEGNYRYVKKKYFKNADSLKVEYQEWISENSEIGKWLRSKNVAEKIGDHLFVHAGISPKVANAKYSIEQINSIIAKNIGVKATTEDLKLLKKYESPYWYRGYFTSQDGYTQATQQQIDEICHFYNIKKMIVGHTPVEKIQTYYQGKVIGIDVLRENEIGKNPPSALLIEKNTCFSVDENGKKSLIH